LLPDTVLGFEAAGAVDAVGPGVTGTSAGDAVTALLFSLGGYAEYTVASIWTRKPETVSWTDAAALPSSAEAGAASEGVPVHRGHRRARVGEQPHVRGPVVAEPGCDGGRVAGEEREVGATPAARSSSSCSFLLARVMPAAARCARAPPIVWPSSSSHGPEL
jgi:Alcohol dehydrogenase GroES-like domain